MDATALRVEYDRIKTEATLFAGDLLDIPRRVTMLYNLYLDSGRNHVFAQIAAHGALWGFGYFEAGGTMGRLLAKRYFYNPAEHAYRLGILLEFAESFRRVNRLVCIDTYTNFHFVGRFGRHPAAGELLPAPLFEALSRVHAASAAGRELTPAEKRESFRQSFLCEQEVTVAPGVASAVAAFQCKVMKFLILHPVVRFSYFPACSRMFFRDFASTEERIAKGLRAYDLAERVGWDRVRDSMVHYGQMSRRCIDDPQKCMDEIRDGVRRAAEQARDVLATR